jgi:hypothetical protein
MTFEEILDQAIAMLQRRGRLTYGALKRQFQLDDAYLEDVKNELIAGQRIRAPPPVSWRCSPFVLTLVPPGRVAHTSRR